MIEKLLPSTQFVKGKVTFELDVRRIDGAGPPPVFVPLEMGCFFVKRPQRSHPEGPVVLEDSNGEFVAEAKKAGPLRGNWFIQVIGFDANGVFYEGGQAISVKPASFPATYRLTFYLTPA